MKLIMQRLKFRKKLRFDCFEFIVDEGAGFRKETNKATFIDKNFKIEPMLLKSRSGS
jgi:phosphopantothenoylcysteine decarboxylase/phosphopantothenate--cysteine ligase